MQNQANPVEEIRSRSQLFAAVLCGGFVVAVYFHYWLAAYGGATYPKSTYLFRPDDRMPTATMKVGWKDVSARHCFGDLYAPYLQTLRRAPYASEGIFPSNYLPFTHALLLPFTLLPYDLLLPHYLVGFAAGVLMLWLWTVRELPWKERVAFAVPAALMAYPPQILMDRGNLEGVVFAFTTLFWIEYSKNSTYKAACFLAAAIAMKGYPVAYSLVFALNAQWRQLLLCAVVSIVLTLASAAIFKGGMIHNLTALTGGVAHYLSIMKTDEGVKYACSLHGLLSIIFRSGLLGGYAATIASLCVSSYSWIQLICGLGILAACIVLPLRTWELLSLLTFSFLLLPLSSPDYRMIHLFLPIAAFIRCLERDSWAPVIAVISGALVIPKSYVHLSYEITTGCVVNPLIMFAAAVLICSRAATRSNEDASLLYRSCRDKVSQVLGCVVA